MRSEEARIGALVRVGESGLRSEWRGLTGRITQRWGAPEYVALDVRLEDGRSQLFWHYELEEVPEPYGGVTEDAPDPPEKRILAPPEISRNAPVQTFQDHGEASILRGAPPQDVPPEVPEPRPHTRTPTPLLTTPAVRRRHPDMDKLISVPMGFLSGLEAQSEIRELLDELFYCDNLV